MRLELDLEGVSQGPGQLIFLKGFKIFSITFDDLPYPAT